MYSYIWDFALFFAKFFDRKKGSIGKQLNSILMEILN